MDKVIAISRQYGSGGRQVGELVARLMGIPFYDREILARAAAQSGIHTDYFADVDQRGTGSFTYAGAVEAPFPMSMQDTAYLAQRNAILELAAKGPCVIVGRGACEVLKGRLPLLRVFIYADLQIRCQRVQDVYHEGKGNTLKQIREVDKKRRAYYSFYEENTELWAEHFDLCIDSGTFGLDKAASIILSACS